LCFVNFSYAKEPFELMCPTFPNEGMIPAEYTCNGENISPELVWKHAPQGTKSFALIVDDPDAQEKIWSHWIIYNIPGTSTGIAQAATKGFVSLATDFYYMKRGVWQYCGPCPPQGIHRYRFTLYALDAILNLSSDASKEELIEAMQEHILDKAQLIGKYQRTK
jgi:Raf kinase inhibitor-like YbhB/YbcL family protein